jgi:hypothetical protein
VKNLPPVSTTLAANFATGTAVVVDTDGKFATSVVEIIGTILDCWHLKVNLKEKIYLYVNSTTQRCSQKIIKTFLIEEFFICHRCQRHQWCTLKSTQNFQKIQNGPNGILRDLEETDS